MGSGKKRVSATRKSGSSNRVGIGKGDPGLSASSQRLPSLLRVHLGEARNADPQQEEPKIERRDFAKLTMAFTAASALFSLGQCSGGTTDFLQWWVSTKEGKRERKLRERDSLYKIQDIFFNGVGPEIRFHPGAVKFEPAARADDDWAAIRSIASLFHLDPKAATIPYDRMPNFRSGLVCVGSPATNSVSNLCMDCGDTDYVRGGDGFTYRLRYKHHTKISERTIHRLLNDRLIIEPNYQIIDTSGRALPYECRLFRDGTPADSYLLFSKLPHPSVPNLAVAVWAGNIGPGTEAVSLLLGSDSALRNDKIDSLWNFSHEHPFFQALLKVDDIELSQEKGRHIPMSIRLIDFGSVQRIS